MTTRDGAMWLPAYFTAGLHAVTDLTDQMRFHGVTVAWSACGRAVILDAESTPYRGTLCDRCVYLVGLPPVSYGQ